MADQPSRAVQDYLEPARRTRPPARLGKHPPLVAPAPTLAETLQRLDELDAQRRALASVPKSDAEIR